jgi:hypothetical protein
MTYRFTSVALNELRTSVQDYESKQTGLGHRFLSEIEGAITRIRMAPQAWRKLSARTRRCLLHRFPFGIMYQVRGEEILVVSVMDLRRDPRSWKQHL